MTPAGSGRLALIRLSNWAEADRALRELVERYPKSSLVPQARYWRARVKHLAGGNAIDDYLDVVRTYPASFYALVASERMRELGAKPPPLFAERPHLPAQAQPSPELALPRALAAAGLWREADEELRSRLGQVHTPEQALRVGSSLARARRGVGSVRPGQPPSLGPCLLAEGLGLARAAVPTAVHRTRGGDGPRRGRRPPGSSTP